ncbi:MAG: hypothetical protein HQL73_06895 [Magnetococcales bacterium]|nr:hypothetical protein [Magnetococcales bacterium]
MKTDEDILLRIMELEETDLFKWESNLLITFLPLRLAQPLLEERGLRYSDHWIDQDRSYGALREKVSGFMETALEVAIGHRGTKAQRSIDYLHAWIWLMEDEEMLAFMDDGDHFPQYGVPILREICRRYDLPWPSDHPGLERMSHGESCQPDGCPFSGCMADWRSSGG